MATAYSTEGSEFYRNQQIKEYVLWAADWMAENVYTYAIYRSTSPYTTGNAKNNWWDWEIGAPRELAKCCMLLYGEEELTRERINKYMEPIGEILKDTTRNNYGSQGSIGANRMDICTIAIMRGALVKDEEVIIKNWKVLTNLFEYCGNYGDGFFEDGSYIQHWAIPYNGHYAVEFMSSMCNMLYTLSGTVFDYEEEKKNNIYDWVYNSFDPFIYKGEIMDMVRGRMIASSTSHSEGHTIIGSHTICLGPYRE